jgi:uncharacterized membrane protein YdjX (TVP38/TMEM64 family)
MNAIDTERPAAPPAGPAAGAKIQERGEWKRAAARLLAFGVFALVICLLGTLEPVRNALSVENIERIARHLGAWGPASMMAAGLVLPLLFLPRWPICVVCGLLYGVIWGTLLSNVASLLGAVAQFYLARSLLAAMARKLVARSKLAGLTPAPHKTFAALFILRAFPLSSFVATNLLAGAMRVRPKTYIIASFLGMLPSSLMYAAWGKVAKTRSPHFLGLIVTVLILLIVGGVLVNRARSRWFAKNG